MDSRYVARKDDITRDIEKDSRGAGKTRSQGKSELSVKCDPHIS